MTQKLKFFYTAKSSKNTIISAKRAIASVRANPKIATLNISSFNEGFLDIPKTSAPKTVPIPTPAPAKPIVAKPAPTNFAACNNIIENILANLVLKQNNSIPNNKKSFFVVEPPYKKEKVFTLLKKLDHFTVCCQIIIDLGETKNAP